MSYLNCIHSNNYEITKIAFGRTVAVAQWTNLRLFSRYLWRSLFILADAITDVRILDIASNYSSSRPRTDYSGTKRIGENAIRGR